MEAKNGKIFLGILAATMLVVGYVWYATEPANPPSQKPELTVTIAPIPTPVVPKKESVQQVPTTPVTPPKPAAPHTWGEEPVATITMPEIAPKIDYITSTDKPQIAVAAISAGVGFERVKDALISLIKEIF